MESARPQERASPDASSPINFAAAAAAPKGPNKHVAWKPRYVTSCDIAARPMRVIAS